MSQEIINEYQPDCGTPKRCGIHTLYKDIGLSIDKIAFDQKTAPGVVEQVLRGPLRRPDNGNYPSEDISKDLQVAQRIIKIFEKGKRLKEDEPCIRCLYSARFIGDTYWTKPVILFAHDLDSQGDGDEIQSMQSSRLTNFTHGFTSLSTRPTLLSFLGRGRSHEIAETFTSIIAHSLRTFDNYMSPSAKCLGGVGQGAKAAVEAINQETTHLVLVGYPLDNDDDAMVLQGVESSVKILYIAGNLECKEHWDKFADVTGRMQGQIWTLKAHGASQMLQTAESGENTREVLKMVGAIAAEWLQSSAGEEEKGRHSTIEWDAEKSVPVWNGWPEPKKTSKRASRGRPTEDNENEEREGRATKRRKS